MPTFTEITQITAPVAVKINELRRLTAEIELLRERKEALTADVKRFAELPARANAKIELANGNGEIVATLTTVQTLSLDSASIKEELPEVYDRFAKIGFRSTLKLA